MDKTLDVVVFKNQAGMCNEDVEKSINLEFDTIEFFQQYINGLSRNYNNQHAQSSEKRTEFVNEVFSKSKT